MSQEGLLTKLSRKGADRATLTRRVAELEREIQECRRLSRRVAELTDVVEELLLPVASRDEAKLNKLLARYSERL